MLAAIGSHFEWRTSPTAAPLPFFSVVEEIGQPVASPAPVSRWVNAPPAPNREPAVLLGVWLGGLAVVILAWARQWWRVRAALRAASPLHLNLPIRAMSSPARLEPGVFGVFRPVLLLPEGIAERLTPAQWETILTHELCHVRRRDNLTAAIHMAVEAIFWFHPLVWWIGKRLVDERERACDEAVLLAAGNPQDYAEGILNVCRLYVESPLACVSGVTGSNLKKRIRAIMTERVGSDVSFAKKLTLAVAGIAVLVMPIVVGMFNAPPLRAQSAAVPTEKFEVASIRRCGDGGGGGQKGGPLSPRPIVSPGRLNTGCSALAGSPPMAGLIQRAYGRLGLGHPVSPGSALPISFGPSWIFSAYYTINAKAAGEASEETMEGPMLQALLEDRFKLKVRLATRQVPVYALTVAKGGSKLKPAAEGTCPPPGSSPAPLLLPGRKICYDFLIGRKGPNTTMTTDEATVDSFSKLLGVVLDRPVINKTGIAGKYDFHLEFGIDQATPGALPEFGPPSDDPPGASIFTVVQEQLGLKLEATKGPQEFLVIECAAALGELIAMPTALFNHLWQSTLFAAAAGLLTLALRRNRAAVRYSLWFAGSCKFLVPFSLLVTIGGHFEWRAAPAAVPLPFFSVVEEIGQPLAPPVPLPRPANVPSVARRWPMILLGVWLSGLSVVVFAWTRQWLRVRVALRVASPLDLDLPIRAVSSRVRLEPGVFGVFRPVLLLPEGITDLLTPSQFEAILAHELCHVRRKDNLTAAIHMAVEAIFWFHPLVWWIGKRLVDERECACDEAVLLAAANPQDYAEGILNVCRLYVESPLVCVSGVTGSDLKKRIRAIMTERVGSDVSFAKKLTLAVAGIAALAAPIMVGVMNAPPLRAQSPPPVAAPAPAPQIAAQQNTPPPVVAQATPVSTPRFEVASIKPCAPAPPGAGGRGGTGSPSPGRLSVRCDTVASLIRQAYAMYPDGLSLKANFLYVSIEGGPGWIKSDRYDIDAEAEGNASREMMSGPMMQALLEDRFKLKIHQETREVPVYALTVAKGGFKLERREEGSCVPLPDPRTFQPRQTMADSLSKTCGTVWFARKPAPGPWTADMHGMRLGEFSATLGRALDRRIVDKTGITGIFDFHLEFAPDQTTPAFLPGGALLGNTPSPNPPPAAFADDPEGPSILTAIQEQLGLKLRAGGARCVPRHRFRGETLRELRPTGWIEKRQNRDMRGIFAFTLIGLASVALGQEFEAVSVKPNKSGSNGSHSHSDRGMLAATNLSLRSMVLTAYRMKDYQLEGPDWLDSERFDLAAKFPDALPQDPEKYDAALGSMMQRMLAERFKLVAHRDQKTFSVYALVVGKKGVKFKEVPDGGSHNSNSNNNHYTGTSVSMNTFAEFLARRMELPVLDMTGLKGFYDLTLDWAPEPRGGAAAADSPSDPGLPVGLPLALEMQLGLKAETRKAPIEILVVDHVERVPTEN